MTHRDGSTVTRTPETPESTGSGTMLSKPAPGSAQSPRIVNSETVINSGGPVAMLPSGSDSISGQILSRLFPPMQDSGSNQSAYNPAGIELEHFRIEERIGMGGMGAVFRAVDTRLQRYVALKLLAPSQSWDQSAVRRFQNEARAAARLDHENVARVFYIGDDRGLNFIAFEFVTGSNVRELIRRQERLSVADTVNYSLQIACALKHTSAMGVVHRDIKPSNIIITPNGRAKLVDLGLARKDSNESQADLTLPGTTLGTFDYIAPEQARDPRSVDVRSDIYSLGCTIYHMLTGQPPYPEGTVLQKLLDHQGREAPDPAKVNPRVPDHLSAIVRRMMNSDRGRRYQTADQLIRDLTSVAATLGLRGVNPEGLVWVASRSIHPRPWLRHVGWVATAGLLLGSVLVLHQYSEEIGRRMFASPAGQQIADRDSGVRPAGTTDPGDSASASVAGQGELELVAGNGNRPQPATLPNEGSPRVPAGPGSDFENLPGDPLARLSTVPDALRIDSQLELDPSRNRIPDMRTLLSDPAGLRTPGPDGRSTLSTTSASMKPATSPGGAEAGPAAAVAATTTGTDQGSTPTVPITTPADAVGLPVTLFSGSSGADRKFRTLEAACAAAEDGSTIELQFTGRRLEKPLRLARRNITIRAAQGHSPVIEFMPTAFDSTEPVVRLISAPGGTLRIEGVQFRLIIPAQAVAERYALVGISSAGLVRLERVAATVVNPQRMSAVLVDVYSPAGRMPADMPTMPSETGRDELRVEIADSFFRGNASLLSLAWPGSLHITLENSAVGLTDDLIEIQPVAAASTSKSAVTISLQRLTSRLAGSLLHFLTTADGPQVQCEARRCIFSLAGSNPLIQMDPGISEEDGRRMLSWRSEWNSYDQAQTFLAGPFSDQPLDYEAWQLYWPPSAEVRTSNNPLPWRIGHVALQKFEADALPPESFQLREPGSLFDNPLVPAERVDAGCDLARLLLPGIDPATAESSAPAGNPGNRDGSGRTGPTGSSTPSAASGSAAAGTMPE